MTNIDKSEQEKHDSKSQVAVFERVIGDMLTVAGSLEGAKKLFGESLKITRHAAIGRKRPHQRPVAAGIDGEFSKKCLLNR